MLKSLTVAAILGLSVVCANAQTSTSKNQSRALTNHRNDATASQPAERPVSAEARAEARRLYKEGVKYGVAGLFTQAAETFEKAVALDPQFADAYFPLGHAYFDLKSCAEAAPPLDRAIPLHPTDHQSPCRL